MILCESAISSRVVAKALAKRWQSGFGRVLPSGVRQLSPQSGLRISNLLGELTGSPGQDHATGNSRREARYQRPYRPR